MDRYEKLLEAYADVLKKSDGYHIAHIFNVGYASLIGLRRSPDGKNASVILDEIFTSPEEMAESFLKNWRWQWLYKHKQDLGAKDYEDITALDNDVPTALKEDYSCQLQEIKQKLEAVLNGTV